MAFIPSMMKMNHELTRTAGFSFRLLTYFLFDKHFNDNMMAGWAVKR